MIIAFLGNKSCIGLSSIFLYLRVLRVVYETGGEFIGERIALGK